MRIATLGPMGMIFVPGVNGISHSPRELSRWNEIAQGADVLMGATAAKGKVSGLIEQLGWQPLDVGGLVQALHLEHMTLMWVRMVRRNQQPPQLVWAMLRR